MNDSEMQDQNTHKQENLNDFSSIRQSFPKGMSEESHCLPKICDANVEIRKATSRHGSELYHETETTDISKRTLTKDIENQLSSLESDKDVPITPDGATVVQENPDVDGGWAWVVFVAGFLQFLVSSGMFYSFSVFFVEFLQAFGESRAKTGWVYSTNSAIHMFSGPVAGFVIVRWGPRTAVILGGLLAGLGYFLTTFASNLNMVFITYSFINALGTSLNYSGWIVGIARFWNRHHALVLGLAMSGSGCGVFLLGPQMETIVNHYSWRGAMLLCAGMSLNFCVFGATIYKDMKKPKKFKAEVRRLLIEKVPDDVEVVNKDYNLSFTTEDYCNCREEDINMQCMNEKTICETTILKPPMNLGSLLFSSESNINDRKRNKIIGLLKSLSFPCMKSFFRDNKTSVDIGEDDNITKLLLSSKFWLIEASCFLSFMATTTVYAIFLDWIKCKGLYSSFSHTLAGSGAGDLFGRILAGALMRYGIPPLILFSGIQLLLSVTIALASLANTEIQLIGAMVGFGIGCGLQSVLYALLPSQMSTGVSVARVLGYLLLVTGAGALTGPPLAGLLVDITDSYDSVVILCSGATAVAAVFNLVAHFNKKYCSPTNIWVTSLESQDVLKSEI